MESYWTLFEQHIAPKSNGLIAVVEIKCLFQGSMTLEEFYTRARILMEEAEFPMYAMKQRTQAKITKEGNAITLDQVMEIARLEVVTQCQLSQM